MPLEFSVQSKQRVERLLSRYPTKQAALLPVQLDQNTWIFLCAAGPDNGLWTGSRFRTGTG